MHKREHAGAFWPVVADHRIYTVWLVLALAAVSATRLRFGSLPIGVGECMLAAWLMAAAPTAFARSTALATMQRRIYMFWLALAALLTLGMVSALVHGIASPGAARDGLAFTFAALVSLAAAGALGRLVPLQMVIRCLVLVLSVYFAVLAALHALVSEWVTMPSIYGERLTGLTANPNQLGMYLAPLPFITLYLLCEEARGRAIAGWFAAFLAQLFAGAAVASDALSLAWLAGAGLSLLSLYNLHRLGRTVRNQKLVVLLSAGILALSASGFALRHSSVKDLKEDLAAAVSDARSGGLTTADGHRVDGRLDASSEVQGEQALDPAQGVDWEKMQMRTRAGLWRSGIDVVAMSPLVGFGPGRHAGNGVPFQGEEVHQSFLDLATMGGIPAALLLGWILWVAASPQLRMGAASHVSTMIVASVATFASFHFMVRHPIFWFYIVLAGFLRHTDARPNA